MSINQLEPQSNSIRKLDPKIFSYEKKKEIIETLKKDNNYVKDENLKNEKIDHHKKKQDVLKKLEEDGTNEEDISRVKSILYPDHKTESVEDTLEWVTEEMKSNMDYRNGEMSDSNKVWKEDMEKLYKLPLSVREEWGERIVNREWFWEFWSTINSGMEYRDMDKDGKREVDNLSESKRFLEFKDKVKGMEMMSVKQHIELMNMVWKQLGIEDKIDLNYINTVFKKYPNENLSKDNDLWRILRWLSVILGKWFVIPVSVDGKKVRSVGCDDNDSWVYVSSFDYDFTRPFFKVVSSPSK